MHVFFSPLLTEESRRRLHLPRGKISTLRALPEGSFFRVAFPRSDSSEKAVPFSCYISARNYPNSSPEEYGTVEGWIGIKTKRLLGEKGAKK